MRLFDRFDAAYCINLDRRPDRLENFDKQVRKYNLGDYTRFSAIDGNIIDRAKYNSPLLNGELGVLLSNLEIIKIADKNKLNTVLIMEDDCEFEDEVINVDEYFDLLPTDWDMLYMGGNHNTHGGMPPPIIINNKICKLHYTFSAHFVVIKNTVYSDVIHLLSQYQSQVDVYYAILQRVFNVYSFYPAIAKQMINYSDIQNRVMDYNWLIK